MTIFEKIQYCQSSILWIGRISQMKEELRPTVITMGEGDHVIHGDGDVWILGKSEDEALDNFIEYTHPPTLGVKATENAQAGEKLGQTRVQ